jgi:hypothetical protein
MPSCSGVKAESYMQSRNDILSMAQCNIKLTYVMRLSAFEMQGTHISDGGGHLLVGKRLKFIFSCWGNVHGVVGKFPTTLYVKKWPDSFLGAGPITKM